MKDPLGKVTEAKKGAEANLITRPASQGALVLEKVAAKANLLVVLGAMGLTERVMKLV